MGIGRFLINAMEELATYYNMEKLTLQVFLQNTNALNFYHSMGFEIDETSPSPETADYLVLCKETNVL